MSVETIQRAMTTDDMLGRFRSRAATYDRENRFFQEDWDELKASGFLTAMVPADMGGGGLSLAEYCQELQRIAEHAPATALAVNMHSYWIGIAAEMRRMGDPSLEWLLREAMNGEIFAAGHAESGNDMPAFLSTASAVRVDGGYRITGHKMFGSLTPVWTRFGAHAMDSSDPNNPMIIHAFIPRGTPGMTVKETWDVLGMRATRSDDTLLDNVFVEDSHVGRIVPAGQPDLFLLCLFGVALTGISAVYLGAAKRVIDLATASAHKKTSIALTRSMAYHPEVQHNIAEMVMRFEAISAQMDRTASDWSSGVDHGGNWVTKLVANKHNVVEGAKDIVDRAMTISGGSGMFKGNELERLYRDIRCGGFHPANSLLAHELVGKIALGIDLGEQPRWG